jgi:hypothetical protein
MKRADKKKRTITGQPPVAKAVRRRVRYGGLPKPPDRMEVPYARSRDWLKGLSGGEMVKIVMATDAFQDRLGPRLDALDAERGRQGKRRGMQPLYNSWELESILVFQKVEGLRSVKEARDRIAGDRGAEDRRDLGFDRPRETNPSRLRKRRVGVPSESTLSRHLARIGEIERRDAWDEAFRQIVPDHLDEFDEFREEARLTALDGTTVLTHHKVPRIDRKTKRVVNADQVTCPEGGYVGKNDSGDHKGEGFNKVIMASLSGMPLAAEAAALNVSEKEIGLRVVEDYGRNVRPHLDPDKLNVMVADNGFNSPNIRRAARGAGLIEQIHHASHGRRYHPGNNAETRDGKRWSIDGYPNWFSNGHREIFCRCGGFSRSKENFVGRDGVPVNRILGSCDNCGHISITSGHWRTVQNKGKVGQTGWVRVLPGEEGEADLSFGNSLTYHDPVAEIYGNKRFAHNEGFNSTLSDRFRFNRHKRWFRRKAQVETDACMIFVIMHALAMEQRRRARAAAQPPTRVASRGGGAEAAPASPPGLALAA